MSLIAPDRLDVAPQSSDMIFAISRRTDEPSATMLKRSDVTSDATSLEMTEHMFDPREHWRPSPAL
jgi:hypothetical protein